MVSEEGIWERAAGEVEEWTALAERGFSIRVGDEEERGGFQVNGSVGGGKEASNSPGMGFGGIFLSEDCGRRGEEGGEWACHGDLR